MTTAAWTSLLSVMTFLWPELLWGLLALPVLVALYVWLLRRRKKTALRYANLSLVKEALGRRGAWRRHLPPALLLTGIAALLLAAARPAAVIRLPSQQETIVLAMDVSGSMRATDVQPDRITAAQNAAKAFVAELPRSVRVAVVSFAGTAAVVQANCTTAMRTLRGRSATKAFAASFAAVMRSGSTSAARMLPETSIASTMVFSADGKVITAAGRAAAISSPAIAVSNNAGGRCRRQARPLPIASLMRPRLAKRSVLFLRRRSSQT